MCLSQMGDSKFLEKFYMQKMLREYWREPVEQEEMLCDEVKRVRKFTYLGDRVIAGGRSEAAVTAGTRCGWVKFSECCEYGWRFSVRLKGAVYKSYVRPAIQYGSEAWCLN